MESLIFIVLLFALVWVLFLLPARRRQKAHQAMQDSVELGDEIITAGGLHGFVREAGEEEIKLEIAPDVVVRLDRRAIAAVARDVPGEEPEPAADEPEPLKEEAAAAEEGS
jgi:preprotein translocase subunit YajC